MNVRTLVRLALLVGVCVWSTVGHAAKAGQAVNDVLYKKQEAKQFLDQKEFTKAFERYLELLGQDPLDKEVNIGLAKSAYATKRYSHALLALERLSEAEPHEARYRVKMAYVYAAMGNKGSAQKELHTASKYDSTILAARTGRLAHAAAENAGDRFIFHGNVGLGVIYDTNANQGPKSNMLTLGMFEDLVFQHLKKEESLAQFATAMLEGRYRLSQTGKWWLVGDVSGYERWNFSDSLRANNKIGWGRMAAGVRYLGSRILADLRMKTTVGEQAHREYPDQTVVGFGPELMLLKQVSPTVDLLTLASYENREYHSPEYCTGHYWSIGEYLGKSFNDNKIRVHVGGRFMGAETRDRAYSNSGWEVSARLFAKLPHNFEISPFVLYREEDYRHPATALEFSKRKDKQWRSGVSLSWDFAQNWSADVGYQYIDNNSNSALYKYDQQLVTVGVTWSF